MADDPLDAVYAFVERAYIRLQAADVLTQCLDEDRTAPLQGLVEMLVLAGPQSLGAFREVLDELDKRKRQVDEDRHQVCHKLQTDLEGYGVRLSGMHTPVTLMHVTPAAFLAMLRTQGVTADIQVVECLQLLQDAHGLLDTLDHQAGLLDDLDSYLQDWLWGVMVQTARQAELDASHPGQKYTL